MLRTKKSNIVEIEEANNIINIQEKKNTKTKRSTKVNNKLEMNDKTLDPINNLESTINESKEVKSKEVKSKVPKELKTTKKTKENNEILEVTLDNKDGKDDKKSKNKKEKKIIKILDDDVKENIILETNVNNILVEEKKDFINVDNKEKIINENCILQDFKSTRTIPGEFSPKIIPEGCIYEKNTPAVDQPQLATLWVSGGSMILGEKQDARNRQSNNQINKYNRNEMNNNVGMNNFNKNYINEQKYIKIDKEKCNELTDDDLACILFSRFKNNRNSLYLNMLNIHKELLNPRDSQSRDSQHGYNNRNTNFKTNNYSKNM
jgi:hypothetical protein